MKFNLSPLQPLSNIKKGVGFFFLALVLTLFTASLPVAEARELQSLLGIGYKHSYASLELPTAAVRYYTLPHIAMDFFMGINTEDKKDYVGMGGQVSFIFFTEQYAHIYFGVSGAYLSFFEDEGSAGTGTGTDTGTGTGTDTQREKKSGFELAPLLGCELFLPHISSVSFSIEMGLSLNLIDGESSLQNFARRPLKAGIFFYF